jgi:hypothetical protein
VEEYYRTTKINNTNMNAMHDLNTELKAMREHVTFGYLNRLRLVTSHT